MYQRIWSLKISMTKKKKKRRQGVGLVIIELILGIVIILAILVALAYFLCPLKKVTVEGTDLYSDDEITGYLLDDKYSVNTIYVFLKNTIFPKGNAEFIDSFTVKMTGRNSIKIIAKEKKILGYVTNDDSEYVYFDFDGIITEISENYVEGYMEVSGVTYEDAQIGDELSIGESEIGYLTSLIKLIEKEDIVPNIISYDEYNHITLCYDSYDISLGSSSYLEEKIDRLCYILPNIENLSGTLHLENYSPNNTDIVFEKEEVSGE